MSLFSALFYTPYHGLVIPTIMDLSAIPFQSSHLVQIDTGRQQLSSAFAEVVMSANEPSDRLRSNGGY